jgi:glycosyltransferase involved in cell wall biosynthesis
VLLKFFDGLSVVLSCETFYNKQFVALAKKKRIKTILQYNFEFLDYMSNETLMLPDVLLAPSLWRFEEVEEKFSGRCMVKYLPPPTDSQTFKRNKEVNSIRTNKLLHIGGKAAIYDRNGTNSVIDMLKHSNSEYELVIKSQTDLKIESEDKRIAVLVGNEINREDMYSGYDAMILPRRYAGLCLPMNEALMSGIPVFMTDISPNNIILPGKWLSDASFVKDFMARIGIKLYEADPKSLAKVVDKYFSQDNLSDDKQEAFDIGYNNFSSGNLKDSYLDLINSL